MSTHSRRRSQDRSHANRQAAALQGATRQPSGRQLGRGNAELQRQMQERQAVQGTDASTSHGGADQMWVQQFTAQTARETLDSRVAELCEGPMTTAACAERVVQDPAAHEALTRLADSPLRAGTDSQTPQSQAPSEAASRHASSERQSPLQPAAAVQGSSGNHVGETAWSTFCNATDVAGTTIDVLSAAASSSAQVGSAGISSLTPGLNAAALRTLGPMSGTLERAGQSVGRVAGPLSIASGVVDGALAARRGRHGDIGGAVQQGTSAMLNLGAGVTTMMNAPAAPIVGAAAFGYSVGSQIDEATGASEAIALAGRDHNAGIPITTERGMQADQSQWVSAPERRPAEREELSISARRERLAARAAGGDWLFRHRGRRNN